MQDAPFGLSFSLNGSLCLYCVFMPFNLKPQTWASSGHGLSAHMAAIHSNILAHAFIKSSGVAGRGSYRAERSQAMTAAVTTVAFNTETRTVPRDSVLVRFIPHVIP